MSAVTIIIDIVLIIIAIILILTVLMQQGQRQGLGAIGGGAETFFGKNKAKSYEGKLAMLTKICAVIFIVLAMVATIVAGSKDSPVADDDVIPAATEDVDADTTDEAEESEAPAVTDEPTETEAPAETEELASTEEPAEDEAEADATEEPVEE